MARGASSEGSDALAGARGMGAKREGMDKVMAKQPKLGSAASQPGLTLCRLAETQALLPGKLGRVIQPCAAALRRKVDGPRAVG